MGEATWAPTPAAPSMATEQKLVCGYVGMPNDDEALEQALAAIHEAIDNINQRDWNWAAVYEDIVSDATLVDYPVPSNFKRPFRLVRLDADGLSIGRIPFVPWMSFLNEYSEGQAASGDPCVYTVANVKEYGTISLDCTPSADWVSKYPTLRLWYYRKLQYENQDGAPDWPSEFTPYVRNYAKAILAGTYAPAKVAFAHGLAEAAMNRLVRDDNNTQTDWE